MLIFQVSNHSKGHSHPYHPHQLSQQSLPPAVNQSSQVPNQAQQFHQITPNVFLTSQQSSPPLSTSQAASSANQVQHSTNPSPHPQLQHHVPLKPPVQRYSSGDNLKEVIVREMPKYKTNLQDFSPDEVRSCLMFLGFCSCTVLCKSFLNNSNLN